MRLTRFRAFGARGVALKYPSRSWSGVRADDGAVILAMRGRDLRRHRRGARCMLWAPQGVQAAMDQASLDERLKHCRLAELRGGAEGLLTYGADATVDPDVLLSLRVVRRGAEYWAEVRP
jgi:hypothetical protein